MGRAVQIEPIACQCCAATAISRQTTMLGDEVCGGVGEALSSLSPPVHHHHHCPALQHTLSVTVYHNVACEGGLKCLDMLHLTPAGAIL